MYKKAGEKLLGKKNQGKIKMILNNSIERAKYKTYRQEFK